MSMETPIKYFIIGQTDTKTVLTEFTTNNVTSTTKKQASQIFQKVCKTASEKGFEGRNKITGKGENYYFKVDQPNILYLTLVDANYTERFIYKMMDDITEDKIPLMVDEGGKELNSQGRQALKAIIDKYQDIKNINKIAAIQSDVDSVKSDLQKNIAKVISYFLFFIFTPF